MTEIICQWLNDEVSLTSRANSSSLPRDFSNGFLFGEILSKYGFQENFDSFHRGHTVEAKLHNFKLLEPSLAMLKISLDHNMAREIMAESPGIANRLAYLLYVTLSKVKRDGISELIRDDTKKTVIRTVQRKIFEHQLNQSPRQLDQKYTYFLFLPCAKFINHINKMHILCP